jgi:hypothetical protein
MVTEQAPSKISFKGSAAQKKLAQRMYEIMRAQSMFSADYVPIRVSTERLGEFLNEKPGDVQAAASKNVDVFAIETNEDETFVVTTRLGAPPIDVNPDDRHSFAARFMTPEPAPERPLRTAKPIPQVVINPEAVHELKDMADEAMNVERELRFEDRVDVEARSETGSFTVEVMSEEEARQRATEMASTLEDSAIADGVDEVDTEPEATERAPVEGLVAEIEAPAESAAAEIDAPVEPAAAEIEPPVESVAAEIEAPVETVAAEAEAPVETVAPEVEAPLETVAAAPKPQEDQKPPEPKLTDLSGVEDSDIVAALRAQLGADHRFANVGNAWMAESQVNRLSRGNLRSLAEYISEQEQPLTDDVLVQDVLGGRRTSNDFAATRFSLNYRLSSERNFEFVGTTDQPFWGTTDLQPIGTTRRKAADIGTDYRFLLDETTADIAPRSRPQVDHTLSFYEFTYGLLPLDPEMMALLPAPVMPDQRSAVMTVEIPQFENSVYLVEVRYPTHNRGGFILGLDDFYDEKLVPGAMIAIHATDNNGHYKIEYLEDDEQQDRFLELDDRRAAKYVFRPLTYDTAVDSDWLVTEDRFPRFGSEKPLSEKKRRRVEDVIEETFRRVGDDDGGKLTTSFTNLLVAVNTERPASAAYMRGAIESMASVTDDGTGMLTYDPSA